MALTDRSAGDLLMRHRKLLSTLRQRIEPTGAGEFVRLNAVARFCPGDSVRIVDLGGGEGNLWTRLPAELRAKHLVVDRTGDGHGIRVIADLAALPFAEGSLDFVCLSDVLEHVTDDRSFLDHIFRSLRPGGTALIHVPSLRTSPFGAIRRERELAERDDQQDYPHVRDGYEPKALATLLRQVAPDSTVRTVASFTEAQSILSDIDWFLWRRGRRVPRVAVWTLLRLARPQPRARKASKGGSGILSIVVKASVATTTSGAIRA